MASIICSHLLSSLRPLFFSQAWAVRSWHGATPRRLYWPIPGRPTEPDLARTQRSDFTETRRFTKSSKLRTELSHTLSFSFKTHSTGLSTWSAPSLTTYNLIKSGEWFNQACTQKDTRAFLESACDNGRNVYLIVGLQTVQDAKLVSAG